jgi:hypothetical protein
MRIQDLVVIMTEGATHSLFDYVRAMPEDKLRWKPAGGSRHALDILQECAQSPTWSATIAENRRWPDFDPDERERRRKERQEWDTIDKCEQVIRENNKKLFAVVRDFPDSELDTKIDLPFEEGMQLTLAQILMGQYWNLTWHIGQIAYIQTMYGDMNMY